MLDKLQAIEDKYLDLEAKISDPDIIFLDAVSYTHLTLPTT